MYTLNPYKLSLTKNIFLLMLLSLLNINCEHCDDEDYTREQEESALQYQDPNLLKGGKQ